VRARAGGGGGGAGGGGPAGAGPPPAQLEPLAPGERPPALLIAVAVCVVLAVAVIVGALSVHDLAKRAGSLPGALVLAGLLVALAVGMARRRYWAVLGFEALL